MPIYLNLCFLISILSYINIIKFFNSLKNSNGSIIKLFDSINNSNGQVCRGRSFFFFTLFLFLCSTGRNVEGVTTSKAWLVWKTCWKTWGLVEDPKLTLRVTLWHLGLCATSDSSRSNSFTTVLQLFYHNSESLKKLWNSIRFAM